MSSAVDSIVLVTGASGYLGSHVVKNLLARGYSVRGTVRSTSNKAKIGHLQKLIDAGEHLDLVEADLLVEDSWPTAVSGCTFVCHVASPFTTGGEDGDLIVKTAVEGTRNVLKSSKADPIEKQIQSSRSHRMYS